MDTEFKPNIIGFLCNWCSYAGADLAGSSKLEIKPYLSVVRVMCSSRVNSNLILTSWWQDAIPEIAIMSKEIIMPGEDLPCLKK